MAKPSRGVEVVEEDSRNCGYTGIWVDGFGERQVDLYASKFKNRFEKNIKHRQQLEFIKKHMPQDARWCDCPIGSGRLMNELKAHEMIGMDRSPAFLSHNREKGIKVVQGNLFDNPFRDAFDVVTCMHTLFAFQEYRETLKGLIGSLKPGGVLIVDLINESHLASIDPAKVTCPPYSSISRQGIHDFFSGSGCRVREVQAHDFWDNCRFVHWKNQGGPGLRKWKERIWSRLNSLYFRTPSLFSLMESLRPDSSFIKYLVAAERIR